MAKADGYAKASLLLAYSKEPLLLAAMRVIADRNAQEILSKNRVNTLEQDGSDSHNLSQQNWQEPRQREDSRN